MLCFLFSPESEKSHLLRMTFLKLVPTYWVLFNHHLKMKLIKMNGICYSVREKQLTRRIPQVFLISQVLYGLSIKHIE